MAAEHVIVGDADGTIRRFDSSGSLAGTFGGRGEGPGEFREIHFVVRVRGDSLVVWVSAMRRASVFSAAGEFGRAFHVSWMPGLFAVEAVSQDLRFAVVGLPARRDVVDQASANSWAAVRVLVFDPDATSIDTLGAFVWLRCDESVRVRCRQADRTLTGTLAFSGEHLLVAPARRPEILDLGADGRPVAIRRLEDGGGGHFASLLIDEAGFV